jgi:hypothetical protein
MRKKLKKPMFFLRIWNLIQKKRHKKVGRIVKNNTIQAFIQTHKGVWWVIENLLLPALLTILFIMFIFIIAVLFGFRFGPGQNGELIIGIVGSSLFLLFFGIVKMAAKHWLQK